MYSLRPLLAVSLLAVSLLARDWEKDEEGEDDGTHVGCEPAAHYTQIPLGDAPADPATLHQKKNRHL